MKILFVIPAMNRGGGAQNQIRLIAKSLKLRGHDVRVIVFFKKGFLDGESYIEELESNGVKVDYLLENYKKQPIKLLLAAVRYLKLFRPEILVSFLFHSIAIMRIASIFYAVPVHISSFRNSKIDTKFRSIYMKITDHLSDVMVINSSQYELSVSPKRKNIVILNAIDINFFKKGKHNKFRENPLVLKDDKLLQFKWIAVGRLELQKNYPMLIKAFKGVVDKYPSSILKIFGEGSLKDELVSFTKYYGISENILFCGVKKDMINEYLDSDAFVITSSWEGFSNALMEACAVGLPSISTNVSGATEMIVNGKNGFVIPVNDDMKLQQAMLEIMSKSDEDLFAFSTAAKENIYKLCELENITDKWEQLMIDLREKKNAEK